MYPIVVLLMSFGIIISYILSKIAPEEIDDINYYSRYLALVLFALAMFFIIYPLKAFYAGLFIAFGLFLLLFIVFWMKNTESADIVLSSLLGILFIFSYWLYVNFFIVAVLLLLVMSILSIRWLVRIIPTEKNTGKRNGNYAEKYSEKHAADISYLSIFSIYIYFAFYALIIFMIFFIAGVWYSG